MDNMDDFHALQSSVAAWHVKTFAPEDIQNRLARKLVEEANEFLWSAKLDGILGNVNPEFAQHLPEEAADCLIVLMAWAHRNGVNLLAEAERKLAIVKARDQQARDIARGIV